MKTLARTTGPLALKEATDTFSIRIPVSLKRRLLKEAELREVSGARVVHVAVECYVAQLEAESKTSRKRTA
jgi:hypothetical protein